MNGVTVKTKLMFNGFLTTKNNPKEQAPMGFFI